MCWLFHKWGKWSEPKVAELSFGSALREPYKAVVQDRTCLVCGYVDSRRVTV